MLLCVVAMCAPASNDAFAPALSCLPAAGGLRRTSCRGTTAVSMYQPGTAQLTRRAAVLGALLPAFAGAAPAHAKGDGTLSFSTQISGSDGIVARTLVERVFFLHLVARANPPKIAHACLPLRCLLRQWGRHFVRVPYLLEAGRKAR
jgi:hypothetical protein